MTTTATAHEHSHAKDNFDQLCRALRPVRTAPHTYAAAPFPVKWHYPYGGVLLAQAFAAAAASVPPGKWIRSLHAYFIEVGRDDEGVELHVTRSRDARSNCWRRVDLIQAGRTLLSAELLFSRNQTGPQHQSPMPDAPPPSQLVNVGDELRTHEGDTFCPWDRDSPFDLRCAATPLRLADGAVGARPARSQAWVRPVGRVVHDRTMATALLIYASDMCMLDPCLRPHGLWFGSGSTSGLSLDHSMWFHAPARMNDWILLDQRSPAMAQGRGLGLAEMYANDGELLCTVAQLGSLRPSQPIDNRRQSAPQECEEAL